MVSPALSPNQAQLGCPKSPICTRMFSHKKTFWAQTGDRPEGDRPTLNFALLILCKVPRLRLLKQNRVLLAYTGEAVAAANAIALRYRPAFLFRLLFYFISI